MRPRLRLVVVGMLTLVVSYARAQSTPAAAASVQVTVVIDAPGRAVVRERYRVPRDTGTLHLQLLARACASVSGVTVSNYVHTLPLSATVHGPFIRLRDTTGQAFNADSSGFDVGYTVALAAPSVDIPLVQLARPIPRREDDGEGSVSLSVRTDDEVRFPRLTRSASTGAWTGRYVAIPSFVRVERAGDTTASTPTCAGRDTADNSDGGLTWRFYTLVAIMVTWVPLYLAWARRAHEGDG
jgi:hypothetical protein